MFEWTDGQTDNVSPPLLSNMHLNYTACVSYMSIFTGDIKSHVCIKMETQNPFTSKGMLLKVSSAQTYL